MVAGRTPNKKKSGGEGTRASMETPGEMASEGMTESQVFGDCGKVSGAHIFRDGSSPCWVTKMDKDGMGRQEEIKVVLPSEAVVPVAAISKASDLVTIHQKERKKNLRVLK